MTWGTVACSRRGRRWRAHHAVRSAFPARPGLVRYAGACKARWRDWFAADSVEPFEITYEDMAEDLDKTVRDIAAFLDVTVPSGLGRIRP
jgi:LPS sulfotransferase NodH